MDCVCKFSSVSDIKKVEPFGYVDLTAANKAGSVPSNIVSTDLSFNEIDDPNAIAGRPRDQFEAAQMSGAILGYKPPKDESKTE